MVEPVLVPFNDLFSLLLIRDIDDCFTVIQNDGKFIFSRPILLLRFGNNSLMTIQTAPVTKLFVFHLVEVYWQGTAYFRETAGF